MATAKETREQAARGEGCLGKAAEDEPVFVLRAQDLLAPALVEAWANEAKERGAPMEKIREARNLAQEMRSWGARHHRKFPD